MSAFTVNELESPIYSATLVNEAGDPFGNLDSLTLTFYNKKTGAIINSRSSQNVLNANGVTLGSSTGLLTWTMVPADNPIIDNTLRVEEHVALFVAIWNGGTKRMNHEVSILVRNLNKLP